MNSFEHFSFPHILWLLICAAGVAVVFCFSPGLSEQKSRKLSRWLAASVFVLHMLESAYRIWEGTFDIGTLPLHVCAIAAYSCVLFEFFPCPFLAAVLFYPCLPGDIAAILFPDWTSYPAFSPMSVLGFLGHLSIACYIFHQMIRNKILVRWKLVPLSIVFLVLYACIMIPFDYHFNVNYGFLMIPATGSPLEFIARIGGGRVGYYAAYALLVLIIMPLWYRIWMRKQQI